MAKADAANSTKDPIPHLTTRRGFSKWLAAVGVAIAAPAAAVASDGSEKVTEQVRVTPQGLAKLAKLFPSAVSNAA